MPKQFSVKPGKVIGRGHILIGKNCQDSIRVKTIIDNEDTYHIAWISDGCSEGSYSEVGSNLATTYLLNKTISYIKNGVSEDLIPYFLFQDLANYLNFILQISDISDQKNPIEKVAFVKDHLLFTLIGYIIGPESTTILAYGDGVFIVNDQIYFRDFNDASPYPGYLLIDPQYLDPNRTPMNQFFDVYVYDTENIDKLAIGSDAWIQEKDLLDKIWGHVHPNQIQRLMNLWSEKDKRLSDDATLVVVESQQT